MGDANMRFLRWIEPADWQVDRVVPASPRLRDPVAADNGAFATLLMVLRDQNQPFSGDGLIPILSEESVAPGEATRLVELCVEREILYRPHRSDLEST